LNNNSSLSTEQENKLWLGDKLDRKTEGEWLLDYLINKYSVETAEHSKNFVLNVNADWGFGKTYFLKNLSLELKHRDHQVIYFDAWKNDFSDKPLLGFISEINDALQDFISGDSSLSPAVKDGFFKCFKNLKSAAAPLMLGFLAKQLVGASYNQIEEYFEDDEETPSTNDNKSNHKANKTLDEVVKTVSSITTKAAELALKEHTTTKNSIESFKTNLEKLVQYLNTEANKKLPLFILVDELDRCRPNYAIELLETIKHLFEVKGVYFIVATASQQLSHSINAVYGTNFESKRYLNRFFDQEYKLAKPNQQAYCQFLWDKYISDSNIFVSVFPSNKYTNSTSDTVNMNVVLVNLVAQYTHCGLRDIEQAIKLLQAIKLTHTDNLYSIIVIFLVCCKVRHPNFFLLMKNKWPKIFTQMTDEEEKIPQYFAENFDNNILLEYRENKTSIRSTLHGMLDQSGITLNHQQGEPELQLSHYIELVEQVGRLT